MSVLNAKLRYATGEQKDKKSTSKFTHWMMNLAERCGHNKTVVAVANKLARVIFSVLSTGEVYAENKVCS